MKPLRTLVLGGAGFLGSHLSERLLAEGCFVHVVDDFSTGSRANVASLRSSPRFRLEQRDVSLPLQLEGQFDWIFNLACPASPVHYQADPVKTTLTNVLGTLHALQLAVKCSARMLQASTSEVYGDPAMHPQPESYWGNVNPIGLRACYDEGKRCAESLAMDFARTQAVDLRLVRIFNTYGPRMAIDDGRVVSNFIVQALRGDELTVYGEGSQTRSFCYVEDLIEGFLRFMRQNEHQGPLNLGNPAEFSVLELAQAVIELTGSRSRIVHRPLPADDPKLRRPDVSQARAWLGFEPRVSLREGLARTIDSLTKVLARSDQSGVHVVSGGGQLARASSARRSR
ncbi:MAG TPA: UDP-glucuronic acid decarboxylase family protein [Polyangiaceae bacterium]|nr:UDP-glucuronic acid decarboxylase family protein [Polyangiaceae bacterium]